jgi:hypothetical protein
MMVVFNPVLMVRVCLFPPHWYYYNRSSVVLVKWCEEEE